MGLVHNLWYIIDKTGFSFFLCVYVNTKTNFKRNKNENVWNNSNFEYFESDAIFYVFLPNPSSRVIYFDIH